MDKYTNLTDLVSKLNIWKQGMIAVFGTDDDYVRGIEAGCAEIEKAPAADVEEVRHGGVDPIYTEKILGRY